MILVDSSVWIDYFNGVGTRETDLLDALSRVRDRLPQTWTLLCVGRDDGILPQLEDLARAQGIANVRLTASD